MNSKHNFVPFLVLTFLLLVSLACGSTLCDYNGETTPSNNLEYMAEEKMACLRIQMVR